MRTDYEDGELKYPAALWVVGKAAYDGLKKWEGWTARAKIDIGGHAFIGYGHTIKAGTVAQITRAQGEALLKHDALNALAAVRANVSIRLAQHEVDALVMLVFNIGPRAFNLSTLRSRLNKNDRPAVWKEWMRWDHVDGREVDGLRARRAYELDLFQGLPFKT